MTYANIHIKANKKHAYLLIDEVTKLPTLFTSIYAVEVLSSKKIGTQKRELSSLKLFHDYWLKKYGQSFDHYLIGTNYNIVECCNQLTSFYDFLDLNEIQIARISNDNQEQQSSKSTRAGHVYGVHRFLRFLNNRYMNVIYQKINIKDVEKMYANNTKRLEDAIRPYSKLQKSSSDHSYKYKSITAEQHILLDDMLLPSLPEFTDPDTQFHFKATFNHHNPFKSSLEQFRNYLIHRLIFNYGLRASEVQLLTVNSFGVSQPDSHGNFEYLMSVDNLDNENSEDEYFDITNLPITLKNEYSKRMISLNLADYNYFLIYTQQFRSPLFSNSVQTGIVDHTILFTSSRGKCLPLTYAAIRKIYQKIDVHFCDCYPNFRTGNHFQDICKLTPHVGRHTWAYITLEYIYNQLLEKEISLNKQYGISSRLIGLLDAAADQLRRLGGWALTSNMPYKYARRYVEKLANEANINRVETENNTKTKASQPVLKINNGEFDAFN